MHEYQNLVLAKYVMCLNMIYLYLLIFGMLSQKHGCVLSLILIHYMYIKWRYCITMPNGWKKILCDWWMCLTKTLHFAWLSNNNIIVTFFFAFQGENPIYKSAVTTVINPKYEGKWWRHSFQLTLLTSIWQLQYLWVWGELFFLITLPL